MVRSCTSLRRFINHEESSHPFTGYIVKKKNKYYYKVNRPGANINRSIKLMHDKFMELLNVYTIAEEAIEPLKIQLKYDWENSLDDYSDLKKSINTKLTEINTKLEKLEERHAFGEINMDVFNKYSAKLIEEKTNILGELEKLTGKISNPEKLVNFSFSLASELAAVWADSDYYQKRYFQDLLFPDGITYDSKNDQYLTPKLNYIFEYISLLARDSEDKKNGSSNISIENSRSVEEAFKLSNFLAALPEVEKFRNIYKGVQK